MARLLDQVVGHRQTLELLTASLQKWPPSMVFTGRSGIGKRLVARAYAQMLVCEQRAKGESCCGSCRACLGIAREQSEHLIVLDPEGGTLKIEESRALLASLAFQKLGRARVVLIDQAHLLTTQAGNALLKIIEEPPEGTHFILLTSQLFSLLPTLRSRSQIVRFQPLALEELAQIIKGVDPTILRFAQGSVEIAQGLIQEESATLVKQVVDFFSTLFEKDRARGFQIAEELSRDRKTFQDFCQMAQKFCRDLLLSQLERNDFLFVQQKDLLKQWSRQLLPAKIDVMAQEFFGMEQHLMINADRELMLEEFWLRSQHYF